MKADKSKHPCFNSGAKGKYGRVHLPVAPECNIQCKYCNRKYDCVNESRPGVTSAILSPVQALEYVEKVKKKADYISTVGIAGPGDPFANPEVTLETLELVHERYPDMIFCLSTNGLGLYPYIDRIKELGVTHVTLTINAVNPEIGAEVYSWVRHKKRNLRGVAAAEALLCEQLKCVEKLKEVDLTVKINSIIIPGINDEHIPAVAKKMAEMKVDIMNCIPLLVTEGTDFENLENPPAEMVAAIRNVAGQSLPMMTHCQRCRADAVGILGCDDKELGNELVKISASKDWIKKDRPYVAVATYEGLLINQHLGETACLQIFREKNGKFASLEKRLTPAKGMGDNRWETMSEMLSDCSVLLVNGIGPKPLEILSQTQLEVVKTSGLIEESLKAVYGGKPIKNIASGDISSCKMTCGGNAAGGCC
jgi:nitrogen fixation protein NifB